MYIYIYIERERERQRQREMKRAPCIVFWLTVHACAFAFEAHACVCLFD